MAEFHLDVSVEVMVALFEAGNTQRFRVEPGLEKGTQIVDVTWNDKASVIRLHFDRPNETPILHNVRSETLACGVRGGCSAAAATIIEFEWNGWSGVIGACWEHHEELLVLGYKARRVDGEFPPEMPGAKS